MSIEKKNGKWSIRYRWKDTDGRVHMGRITNPGWETKLVGIRYMRRIEQQVIAEELKRREAEGQAAVESASPLEHSVGDVALAFLRWSSERMRGTTLGSLESHVKKIVRLMGGEDVAAARMWSPQGIEDFKNRLRSDGLAVASVNCVIGVYKRMVEFAVRRGIADPGATGVVEDYLPKVENTDPVERANYWSPEEWAKFDALFPRGDPYGVFYRVVYWAGLRVGEALGLQAGDFSAERHTIMIARELNHYGQICSPKTKSSVAPVDIPSALCDELAEYIRDRGIKPGDRLFTGSRTSYSRKLADYAEKAGIKGISLHGLRHSIASRMIAAGVNPLIVSKHLRHSSMGTTLSVYTHMFEGAASGVMDKL